MPAGLPFDEEDQYWWLDTNPADLDAPTAAEINAGTELGGYMTPDGFSPNAGNSRTPGGDAKSSFDGEAFGRHQSAPTLMLKRRLVTGEEAAWTLFKDRKVSGCLIVLPFAGSATPIAGMLADVYPDLQTGVPVPQNRAANTEQRFRTDLAVGDAPHLGVTVA